MSFISDILAAWDPLGGDGRARCAHLPSYRWATCQRYSRIFWRSATALYHRAEVAATCNVTTIGRSSS